MRSLILYELTANVILKQMKLNVFKKIASSRKKGLLASNLNASLILGSALLILGILVTLGLNVRPVEPEPFLRFKDELEQFYFGIRGVPYDRGAWYRPVAILGFAVMTFGINVYVASALLKQKWPNVSSAVLMVSFFVLSMLMIISAFVVDFYDRAL